MSDFTPVPKPSQRTKKKGAAAPPSAPPPKAAVDALFEVMPLDRIVHGRNPRFIVDSDRHKDLTASVRQYGVLQPIRVRPTAEAETYAIIAGHRRFEAARSARLATIPVVVARGTDDAEAFIQSIVENLQREDLDPIDTAKAFQAILDETGMTQVELAKKVGWSQPSIANSLALLSLTDDVQAKLQKGDLTVGHARVIARMPPDVQKEMATSVVVDKLTVRDVEQKAADRKKSDTARVARGEFLEREASTIHGQLKEAGFEFTDYTVIVYDSDVAVRLRALGYPAARATNWKTDNTFPKWTCECKALWVTTNNGGKVQPACVLKAHERAYNAAAKADERKAVEDANKRMDVLDRALARALTKDDPSLEVMRRLELYALVNREQSYEATKRKAFVERNGGIWPGGGQDGQNAATWEAVIGLNTKDLHAELARAATDDILPNVYTAREYEINHHLHVRVWLVEELKLSPDLIDGGRQDKEPVTEVDEEYADLLDELAETNTEDESSSAPLMGDGSGPITEAEYAGDPVPDSLESALADAGITSVESDADALSALLSSVASESAGVEVNVTTGPEVSGSPLADQTVCITGIVASGARRYTRTEAEALVLDAGGRVAEFVNRNTTLLVIGEKPGASKVNKATELGIVTITAQEFLTRIGIG